MAGREYLKSIQGALTETHIRECYGIVRISKPGTEKLLRTTSTDSNGDQGLIESIFKAGVARTAAHWHRSISSNHLNTDGDQAA